MPRLTDDPSASLDTLVPGLRAGLGAVLIDPADDLEDRIAAGWRLVQERYAPREGTVGVRYDSPEGQMLGAVLEVTAPAEIDGFLVFPEAPTSLLAVEGVLAAAAVRCLERDGDRADDESVRLGLARDDLWALGAAESMGFGLVREPSARHRDFSILRASRSVLERHRVLR